MRTLSRVYLAAAVAAVPVGVSAVAQPSAQTAIETQKFGSVLGIEVRTDAERNIGRIVDLLADSSGHVQAAIVEFGGFLGMGSRKIAIEWSALRLETVGKQTVAILDMAPDQLRTAPEYKPEQPIVLRKIVPPTPRSETAPSEKPAAAQPRRAKHAPGQERKRKRAYKNDS